MTEISILRALESTNAVNRVLGEALGEALQGIEQIKDSIGTLLDRTNSHSSQMNEAQRQIGTVTRLLEQYSDDLTQYARSSNEQITQIRKRLDELSSPPTDPSSSLCDEPTNPSIQSHLAIAR